MSTLLDVINSLRTELNSQLSIATSAQLDSDHQAQHATMASGATAYQIRAQYQQGLDTGNVAYKAGAIELEMRHKLADGFDERTYTEGAMLTQQALLLSRAFWRSGNSGLTGIDQVVSGPEIEVDVTRVGRIIRWSVLVTFRITP